VNRETRSRVLRYAAVATGVYLAASLVALTVPELLGSSHEGLALAGGALILLCVTVLSAALVIRTPLGIALAALVTGAMVLVSQVVLLGLGAAGIPGLLTWDGAPGGVVLRALGAAVTFALFALLPAAGAGVIASSALRVWRARRRLRQADPG
jgi:hypothetical protein